MPWELIQRELAQIEQEKGRLRTTLADIEQRLDAEQATVDQLQSVTSHCQRAGRNLDTFDFAKKRLAFEALDVKVIANGREWRLTGSIPLEDHAGIMSITSPIPGRPTG